MSESVVLTSAIYNPYIRTPIPTLAAYLAANLNSSSLTPQSITTILQSYVQANPPSPLPLQAINPDFEANKAEMGNILAASNNAWADEVISGIGQTLSEMVATALTFNQMSIEKGVQESILDTAVLDSSIYEITRMLGVKIKRRIPANVPVLITNPISNNKTLTIPAYTALQISGINYFNRTPIIIPASPKWSQYTKFAIGNTVFPSTANGFSYVSLTSGITDAYEPNWPTNAGNTIYDGSVIWEINTSNLASVQATLYEGQLNFVEFTTSGVPFEIFEFGNSDFTISNQDIVVTVTQGTTAVAYNATTDQSNFSIGLWEFGTNDCVYEESTNSVGNVELKFGNGTFGVLPLAGSTVNVLFAITNGQEGNANLSGNVLTCASFPTVSGSATGLTTQGSDQISAFDYKNLGPGLFAAKYRAVTPQDYASVAITYPGVIDAIFLGQAIFQPNNLMYMMNVQAVLLTTTVWSSTQWQNFVTWMTNLGCTNIVLLQVIPTALVMPVSLNIYCTAQADLDSIQNQVIANLQAAFSQGVGTLGYSRYESDISNLIRQTSSQIDYFDIVTPSNDTIATNYQYITLGNVVINMAYSTRPLRS